MSPKHHSLAFDETLREFSGHDENDFEPELKVIVNANYGKAPAGPVTSTEVIQVQGRITVSF